jgi:hypothetical protein
MARYNGVVTRGNKLPFLMTNARVAYEGEMACLDTATNKVTDAIVGTPKATLLPVGRFCQQVTGTGSNTVEVELFDPAAYYWWKNSATNAVTASHIGLPAYVEDGQTVGSLVTGRSVAGTVLAIDTTKGVLLAMRSVHPASVDLDES